METRRSDVGLCGEGALGLTLISVAVGLALAVAYHIFASRFQSWTARRFSTAAPAFAILGFIIRLAVITVVLVLIGVLSPLNILAVCLAFVVLYSILTGWSIYRLMSKRQGAPPSAAPPA
jgi:phosphoglycerol transferase MdoB-like AlkP superfamily enzyme